MHMLFVLELEALQDTKLIKASVEEIKLSNKIPIIGNTQDNNKVFKGKLTILIVDILKYSEYSTLRAICHQPLNMLIRNPTLSQKWSEKFNALDIDIHDPQFGAWWNETPHSKQSTAYNIEWETFFENPSRTKDDVFKFADDLSKEFGYDWSPPSFVD